MGSTAPPGLSLVSLLSLLACSLQLAVALLLARCYGGRSSRVDWWVLLWLFYDVIVHLTLVGPIRSREPHHHHLSVLLSDCLTAFPPGGAICLHVSRGDSGVI